MFSNNLLKALGASAGWEVAGRTLDSTADIGALGGNDSPTGVGASTDGTKFLVGDSDGNVYEYTASTPWDLSTVTLTDSDVFEPNNSDMIDIWVKEDGSRLFVMDSDGQIAFWDLSTSWDLSTAGTKNGPDEISSDDYGNFQISEDGSRLYAINSSGTDAMEEYPLSTPFDTGTIGTITSSTTEPIDPFHIRKNGKQALTGGSGVGLYDLSTDWDWSSKVLNSSLSVLSGSGVLMVNDGKQLLVINSSDQLRLYTY